MKKNIIRGGMPQASATGAGGVELATSAETVTGTDTARAATPAGVAAALLAKVPPKMLLCVIQPDASGVWTLIDDSTHDPFGGVPVITQTSGQVTVTYPTVFTKIYSAYVTVDESLAKGGFNVGPSVGLSSMGIQFQRSLPMGGLLAWSSGTTFAWSSGGGDTTLSWASNELTITCPHPVGGGIGVSRFDGCHEPRVSSAPNGGTQVKIKFFDSLGVQVTVLDALCKCCVIIGPDAADNIWINPTGITSAKYSSANVWVAVFGE